MDYTLHIRPANNTEWDQVMALLAALQITGVLIDEDTIYVTASPVTLARFLSVITGALSGE